MKLTVSRAKKIVGSLRCPSDKSLTHRAYMFSAAASGPCTVRNPLLGEDCESTLACLEAMGLSVNRGDGVEVVLNPRPEWTQPSCSLDCGNSGTTMRLLSGLVASRPLEVTMIGDASLSRRPMARIAKPLRLMGAEVEGDTPPLRIKGSATLNGIRYESPVASAQIKSCVLLAGLRSRGDTTVVEPNPSRDHTERMLRALGVSVVSNGGVTISPRDHLDPFEFTVPADISSAAFFMAAASVLAGSRLLLQDLSINPTRTGILDVLVQCGAGLSVGNEREEMGEPVAEVEIEGHAQLGPFTVEGSLVPRLIDEIPVLAVLATQCEGTSVIRDASELRVKESDRIELIAKGLRAMGARVATFPDGMEISGPTPLSATTVDAQGDHRIGMAFSIAGLLADGETTIEGAESIATSFPGFEDELRRVVVA